jgi:hypothetical protein
MVLYTIPKPCQKYMEQKALQSPLASLPLSGKKGNVQNGFSYTDNTNILHFAAMYMKNKVNRFLRTLFQALVAPSERHLESNQRVHWRPPRPRPPLNLLIHLQMSLGGSGEGLGDDLQKQSCFVLNIHDLLTSYVPGSSETNLDKKNRENI